MSGDHSTDATDRAVERLTEAMANLDTAAENAPEITEDRRRPEDDHLTAAIADANMRVEEAIAILEGERDPRRSVDTESDRDE